jgi:hypothetical protein
MSHGEGGRFGSRPFFLIELFARISSFLRAPLHRNIRGAPFSYCVAARLLDLGQLVCELVLIVAALVVSHFVPKAKHRHFAIGFAALAAIVNYLFYRIAVVPIYRANGFSQAAISFSVAWQTIRWGVLAFVMGMVAVRLEESGVTSGFALLRSPSRLPQALAFGLAAGAVAAVAMYGLSFVEHRFRDFGALPWPIANGQPVDVRFAIAGGLRNLVGEEIFARLGAQSVVLYFLRRSRRGAVIAVIVSSLCFEIWHNPIKFPQFLNFTGSCFFGWAYHKYGYESAAVAHCVADWLVLAILPLLLFAR